ncbi:MAG: hypothetical protein K0R63_1841 [Rickettsiales bacterium]|jgi:uncharacterized protein (UPF0262 family)|nr:hypothetical protein [Rickettsiales bacterium]
MSDTDTIASITLAPHTIPLRHAGHKNEVDRAIEELLKENHLTLASHAGPYHLLLSVEGGHMIIDISVKTSEILASLSIPLSPFRRLMKDYELICESYHQAIENAFDRSKIEAIDMGRRGLHNEGAELLLECIGERAKLDFETARRLFTLFFVLHMR